MAIAVDVAALGHNEVSATSTTIAFNTTATVASGARIIVFVYHFNASVTLSSIGGGSLTWVIDHTRTSGSNRVSICSADAPSGLASGTTITATFSATTADRLIQGSSFTGIATGASGYVDVTGGASQGAVTGWTTGNIATTNAEDLIVGCAAVDGGSSRTSTATSPSIELNDFALNSSDMALTSAYRIETSTGTYTVAGTLSSAATTGIHCPGVAYKSSSAPIFIPDPIFRPKIWPMGLSRMGGRKLLEHPVFPVFPPGAPQFFDLTNADELDAAVAFDIDKKVAITSATETDAAVALTKSKRLLLTSANETDAAQALDIDKKVTLVFASEADAAQALTKFKKVSISAALETDAAQALTKKKTVVIIPATETDSAVAITFTQGGGGAQFITITAATETDAAQALKVVKKPTITPATETDLAQALTKLKRLGIVPASETDAAQALRAYHPRTLTPAGETDSAVALTKRKQVTITPASETDAAQLLKVVKRLSITPANETDAAQLLRHFKLLTLGIASEVDAAQALTKQKRVTISPALEFDIAVPLSIAGETVTIVYRYRGPIRIGRF